MSPCDNQSTKIGFRPGLSGRDCAQCPSPPHRNHPVLLSRPNTGTIFERGIQMDLQELGWNEFHEKNYNEVKTPETFPARVAKAQREKYWLFSAFGEIKAEIKGKMRFSA